MKKKYIIFFLASVIVIAGGYFGAAKQIAGLMFSFYSPSIVAPGLPDLLIQSVIVTPYNNNYLRLDLSYGNQGEATKKPFQVAMQFPHFGSQAFDFAPLYIDSISDANKFFNSIPVTIPNKKIFLVHGGLAKGVTETKTFFVSKYYFVNPDDAIVFTIDEDNKVDEDNTFNNIKKIPLQKDLWEIQIDKNLGCQKITKPGTYTVRPCDQIFYNGNNLTIKHISYSDVVYDREIIKSNSTKKFYGMTLLPKESALNGPNIGGNGFNMSLVSINDIKCGLAVPEGTCPTTKPTAQITVWSSCLENYNSCKQNNPFQKPCSAYCEQSDGIKDIAYFETPHTILDVPVGYEYAGLLASKNAENCFNMISQETGMKPKEKIPLSYGELITDESYPSANSNCHFGTFLDDKVWCSIVPQLKNSNIRGAFTYAEPINQVSKSFFKELTGLLDAGICLDTKKGLIKNMAHEIAHNMAHKTAPSMNSEGFADYIASLVTWTPLELPATRICEENSWKWAYESDICYPYVKLTQFEYGSGACFFQKMKEKHGAEIVSKIFKKAGRVMSEKKQFCYNFFQDIIDPIEKNIITSWVNKTFPRTDDYTVCSNVVNE